MRGKLPALARGVLLLCIAIAICLTLFYPRPKLPFELEQGEKAQRLGQYEGDHIVAVYLAEAGSNRRLVQIATSQGFKGPMQFQVDIDLKAKVISRVQVLSQQETEDYGGYVTEDWFLERFVGKSADSRLRLAKMAAKTPEEVVAITGATVTSRGALDAVNKCLDNYLKLERED